MTLDYIYSVRFRKAIKMSISMTTLTREIFNKMSVLQYQLIQYFFSTSLVIFFKSNFRRDKTLGNDLTKVTK